MLKSIRYNLSNLTNFAGRDARQTFWYYVLFIVVMQILIGLIASIPMYVSMVSGLLDSVASGASEGEAALAMAQNLAGQLKTQVVIGMVLSAVSAGLIVASLVRRLHDGGFSGWIAAIPLATQAFSIAYSFATLDQLEELMLANVTAASAGAADPMAMQAEMGLYGLVGWIGYLVVVGFGVVPSQAGANKYGEEPVRS